MRAARFVVARAPLALVTALSLAVSPAAPLLAVQAPAPAPPKVGPPAPKATAPETG